MKRRTGGWSRRVVVWFIRWGICAFPRPLKTIHHPTVKQLLLRRSKEKKKQRFSSSPSFFLFRIDTIFFLHEAIDFTEITLFALRLWQLRHACLHAWASLLIVLLCTVEMRETKLEIKDMKEEAARRRRRKRAQTGTWKKNWFLLLPPPLNKIYTQSIKCRDNIRKKTTRFYTQKRLFSATVFFLRIDFLFYFSIYLSFLLLLWTNYANFKSTKVVC